jgi:hypothetical protein
LYLRDDGLSGIPTFLGGIGHKSLKWILCWLHHPPQFDHMLLMWTNAAGGEHP